MRKPATLRTILPPLLAFGVGATLFAAYVAPFYGALDHEAGSGEGAIIIENFDMPEDMQLSGQSGGQSGGDEEKVKNPLPDASGAMQNKPLERIEPRPPLSALSLATPVQEKPAETAPSEEQAAEGGLFYRPVALAAGRLAVGSRTIELNGIDIVEPDAVCADINGDIWQCGMQARTAFRSWLRGRAVACNMDGVAQDQPLIRTTCSLAGTDIARWLVENGWARATFGGAYTESQTQAEKKLLGVFGRKPATHMPESSATVPEDSMPADPENTAPAPSMPAQETGSDLPFPPVPQ
ncbi:thermonuclease family protein [Pseudochrobactrum sp. HB0163]|uniref:thermonuclease family protein n=1 Tax=Pseudochrobactrum sp. HB0163 TaxID=3450708 RepID=UPI003F6E0D81